MNNYVWRRWGELDQLVRAMARTNPAFSLRVADAPARAVHAYALVMRSQAWAALDSVAARYQQTDDADFRLALVRDPANTEVFNRLARTLHDTSPRVLLKLFCKTPLSLYTVLDRCGDQVLAPKVYASLVALLANPITGPVLLAHNSTLDGNAIMDLHDAVGFDPHVIKAMVARGLNFVYARYVHELMRAVTDVHGESVLPAFAEALDNWPTSISRTPFEHILERLPAAPAPWPGDNNLHPLTHVREIKTVSQRFRNCMMEHALPAVLGVRCFYLWTSEGTTAAVCISRQPDGSWAFYEMKAPGNAPVPEADAAEILARLERAGISRRRAFSKLIEEFEIPRFYAPRMRA